MKNIYLVKKDPNCKKEDIEWRTLDAGEFIAFTRSEEGRGRHFIRLPDETGESGNIIIEANAEEYRDWKREQDHYRYLRAAAEANEKPLSLEMLFSEDAPVLNALISEDDVSIECAYIHFEERAELRVCIVSLPQKDRELLEFLYLGRKEHSEAELAAILGISQQAVHKHKIAVLKKISKFLGC